jgi:hypothetical protein
MERAAKVWLWRSLAGVLLGTGLAVGGFQLVLNTPLGPWLANRRPERLRIDWDSAWSWTPGRLEVRGLRLRGSSRSTVWRLEVDRGHARIRWSDLLSRRFHLESFTGEGARFAVARRQPVPARRPKSPSAPSRPGWTVEIDRAALEGVQLVRLHGLEIAGAGRARGRMRLQAGGDFALTDGRYTVAGGRLLFRGAEIARGVDLRAEAAMAPFAVRRHPGLESLDFISGSLNAGASLAAEETGTTPGRFRLALRVEQGRLAAGSRLDWAGPPTAAMVRGRRGVLGPLTIAGGVIPASQGPLLRLTANAAGLVLGGAGRPPVVQTGAVTLAATTAELSLRRLFGTARQLGRTAALAVPFAGEVAAADLRLGSVKGRLGWQVEVDRARGSIDLSALLDRRVVLYGLQGEGAAARIDVLAVEAPAVAKKRPGWSVEVEGARVTGVREVAFGERRLAGDGTAEFSLAVTPGSGFELRRGRLEIPRGRYRSGATRVSDDLTLRTEARLAPRPDGAPSGPAGVLRRLSGRAELTGTARSLGLLDRLVLDKAPWLRLDARGRLAADLRLEAGRLMPGTSVTVRSGHLSATLLDDAVAGSGTVTARVVEGPAGPRGELRAFFDRFSIAPSWGRPGVVLVRGGGLALSARSDALDLASRPMADLRAEVRLPSAEVPDLKVFDAYLPERTGVSILGGRGRMELSLTLDSATQTAAGRAQLRSRDAAVQVQDLELRGAVTVAAVLDSRDLGRHEFRIAGSRVDLAGITYREIGDDAGALDPAGAAAVPGAAPGWWSRVELTDGALTWGKPPALHATARIRMKDADLLLNLFSRRRHFLAWFRPLLRLEGLEAVGDFRIGDGAIVVDPLQVTGGALDLRSRLRFSGGSRRGELLVRYGRLTTGIELVDGRRTFHLRQAERWFEDTAPAAARRP